MVFYTALVNGETFSILHPGTYKKNPLYGKLAMELTHECPTDLLLEIVKTPLSLGHTSTRQSNRMTVVACNAAMEYDFRAHGVKECKLDEKTQERIVKTACKLLKKDLPMRAKSLIDLYIATIRQLGIQDML